jgi:hypothetical protein
LRLRSALFSKTSGLTHLRRVLASGSLGPLLHLSGHHTLMPRGLVSLVIEVDALVNYLALIVEKSLDRIIAQNHFLFGLIDGHVEESLIILHFCRAQVALHRLKGLIGSYRNGLVPRHLRDHGALVLKMSFMHLLLILVHLVHPSVSVCKDILRGNLFLLDAFVWSFLLNRPKVRLLSIIHRIVAVYRIVRILNAIISRKSPLARSNAWWHIQVLALFVHRTILLGKVFCMWFY